MQANGEGTGRMTTATKAGQYQDSTIDVKLVLSALWIAMLIVFAYGVKQNEAHARGT